MEIEKKRIPRRRYFIKKRFQSYFILRFSMWVFFSTLLLGAILFYTAESGTTIFFKDFRLQILPTNEYLLSSLTSGLLISITVTLVFCFIIGLLYSHRISGPMYRFEKIFCNLENGKLKQPVKLRSYDEWQETASRLDKALTSLCHKMNELNGSFHDLKKVVDVRSQPEISKKIDQCQKSIEQFYF
ncbi:MAG: hypothetical protein JW774_04410 [Candidatus Aureabacteria bacterium]|nr:hypothetical protein [Candidatus Auribacterota bacterium]